jgi:hypothetical protein
VGAVHVDRDVQVLPADAAVAVRAPGLLAEHALARLPEAAELLDCRRGRALRAGRVRTGTPANAPGGEAVSGHGGAAASRLSRPATRPARRHPAGRHWRTRGRRGSAARAQAAADAAAIAAPAHDRRAPPSLPAESAAKADNQSHRLAPQAAAAARGLAPSMINDTSRHRDSNEKRIRLGGHTRSCISASCASWVLVDHKARRRPGRKQPSRRSVDNRPSLLSDGRLATIPARRGSRLFL